MINLNITLQRLRNHHLTGARFENPQDTVHWFGAIQSQDYHGAKWAIAQRTRLIDDGALDQLFNDGVIMRTHVLRPTWHFVAPPDIRWMLKLTAPSVKTLNSYYDRKLELDEKVFLLSNRALRRALRNGEHLTRAELAVVLQSVGVKASGPRLAYIIMRAELDAIICSGALRGRQFTYALLDERVPPSEPYEREEALAELTRRYFTSHGPATLQDYTWWSSLPASDARAGLEMNRQWLTHETLGDRTYWFAEHDMPRRTLDPRVHLLPNYDEYLVAYKDHGPVNGIPLASKEPSTFSLPMAHRILMDGTVIGDWRRTIKKDEVLINTKFSRTPSDAELTALRTAVEEYGKFYRKTVKFMA